MNTIKNYAIAIILIFVASSAFAQTACAKNSEGQITNTGTVNCYAQPDDYQITIYKIGLCTLPPSASTTNAVNYNNCAIVYNSVSGVTVSITKGLLTGLPGGYTKPPVGTYTSAFIEMGATFSVKGSNTFAYSMTGGAGGSGSYCWTSGGSVYTYQTVASNAVECNTVTGTSASTTTVMNGFNGSATFSYANTVNGVPVSAYLVKSDYKLPSSGSPNVSNSVYRMIGVASTTNTVTDATKSMNVAFDVSNGATLSLYTSGATQKIDNYSIGPFAPKFTLGN